MERRSHCNWGQTEGIAFDRPALSSKEINKNIATRYKIGNHDLVRTSHLAGLVNIRRDMDRMDSSSNAMVGIEMAGRS